MTKRPPAGAVIITGSGSGIGAATAVILARRGYRVVAAAHSRERVTQLRERIDAAVAGGAGAVAGLVDIDELDVTDEAAIPLFVERVVARHGSLHAVVSNAGRHGVETFEDEDLASYRRLFDVNVFGPVALLKAAFGHLRASRGRIVAVGSVAGVIGLPFMEAYSGSRFALEGVLESLAPVARRVGVTVSIVSPGPTGADAARKLDWPRILGAAGPFEAVLRQYVDNAEASAGPLPGLPATQTVEAVATAIADVLAADDPPFRHPTAPATAALLARKLRDLDGDQVESLVAGWVDPPDAEVQPPARRREPPDRPTAGEGL